MQFGRYLEWFMNVHLGRIASLPDGWGRLVCQLASYMRIGSPIRLPLSDANAAQSGRPLGWAYPSHSDPGMHAPMPYMATHSPAATVRAVYRPFPMDTPCRHAGRTTVMRSPMCSTGGPSPG